MWRAVIWVLAGACGIGGEGETTVPRWNAPSSLLITTLAVADLDGDGRVDVLAGAQENPPTTNAARWLLLSRGRADGVLGEPVRIPLAAGLVGWLLEIGDVDGDGHADIVMCAGSPHMVGILSGPDGWAAPRFLDDGDARCDWVTVKDLDGDGKADLIVAQRRLVDQSWQRSVAVFFSGGTITRLDPPREAFAAGDVDGDGTPDLVTLGWFETGSTSTRVLYRRVHPDGTIDAPAVLAFVDQSAPSGRPVVADLDGDGRADALFEADYTGLYEGVNLRKNWPYVALARSAGERATEIGVMAPPWAVADFDGDGRLDLAHGRVRPTLLSGDGSGVAFSQKTDVPLSPGWYAKDMAAGDYDGDGRADLALLLWTSQYASAIALAISR